MRRGNVIAVAVGLIGLSIAIHGATSAGPPPRWYQAAGGRTHIDGDPRAVVQFIVDAPGLVKGLYAVPMETARYGPTDLAVGSVLVSSGQELDDVFDVHSVLAPRVLHRVADLGLPTTADIPVQRGDVVTVLFDDDETTSPDWPAAIWILEVEE